MNVIKAYAKLNLRLLVCGKNEKNYHELQMVNVSCDLYDELIISPSNYNNVEFSDSELNKIINPPLLRILNDFEEKYKLKKHYHVFVNKSIPYGAGLGGGTSDSAALINFLLEDNKLVLNDSELLDFALKYGADVPYSLYNKLSIVTGIGDTIKLLDVPYNDEFILAFPFIHINTKDSFDNVLKYSKKDSIDILESLVRNKDYHSLLCNDLEESTFSICPKLKELKEMLSEYGNVVMSGSGSSFILKPVDNIDKVLAELKSKFNNVDFIKVKTI